MTAWASIDLLDPDAALAAVPELAAVLVDCVAGGASVSFLLPFTQADGEAYFRGVADSVARGTVVLLAARFQGSIAGTVQLGLDVPPNQPHRADLRKMLVHRRARRLGMGAALVRAAERTAAELGRTLLVLDTVTGGTGERLYRRLGWNPVGVIPDYALFPAGGYCSTTYFWKRVGSVERLAETQDADGEQGGAQGGQCLRP